MTSQWARWRLKSPVLPVFIQPFIQAQVKENIKARRHSPLWGEFTGDLRIPRTKGPVTRKCFHLMTSSCSTCYMVCLKPFLKLSVKKCGKLTLCFHNWAFICLRFPIFTFRHMFLGVKFLQSRLQLVHFYTKLEMQYGCQLWPLIAATKTLYFALLIILKHILLLPISHYSALICYSFTMLRPTHCIYFEAKKHRTMHGLPWITILWSRVRRFANNFHEWRSHEWKSLANRITSDPKIAILGNEGIILFLARYFMSWTHNSTENNHLSLISLLSLRMVFSDLALWRHHSWFTTFYFHVGKMWLLNLIISQEPFDVLTWFERKWLVNNVLVENIDFCG